MKISVLNRHRLTLINLFIGRRTVCIQRKDIVCYVYVGASISKGQCTMEKVCPLPSRHSPCGARSWARVWLLYFTTEWPLLMTQSLYRRHFLRNFCEIGNGKPTDSDCVCATQRNVWEKNESINEYRIVWTNFLSLFQSNTSPNTHIIEFGAWACFMRSKWILNDRINNWKTEITLPNWLSVDCWRYSHLFYWSEMLVSAGSERQMGLGAREWDQR